MGVLLGGRMEAGKVVFVNGAMYNQFSFETSSKCFLNLLTMREVYFLSKALKTKWAMISAIMKRATYPPMEIA